MKFGIRNKLFVAYFPLITIIIILSTYSLISLKTVYVINKSILSNDVRLVKITDDLIQNLFTQESYGRRYIILKRKDVLELLQEKANEITVQLNVLKNIRADSTKVLDSLETALLQSYIKSTNKNDKDRKQILNLLETKIARIKTDALTRRDDKVNEITMIVSKSFVITLILSCCGLLFGISASIIITNHISTSINELKTATKLISEGKFDYTTQLNRKDELGELATNFHFMSKRLKQLEEMYLDASPLTHLPGGIAIENVLKKRLASRIKLAFCLIDLDNFKAFNDRYGYASGNDVIRMTAKIISSAATNEDFIGHIGGDDFVAITKFENYENICKNVITKFDKQVIEFYNEDDRKAGCIHSKNRQGNEMQFPIMTISIAVVTNSKPNMNHVQMGEIAAELKEYVKSLKGSNFVLDRRTV